ncbi:MAG: hypothetical protein IPP74_14075 [Alphaproteobacteria bacterium]|nr:hypothetical protein [Alphaproteobacteria bacterium]
METEISKLLKILNTKKQFLGGPKTKDYLDALDQFGEIGTFYDSQHIVPYVFSDNSLIAQKAAFIIRKLLGQKGANESWQHLFRQYSYYDRERLFNSKSLKHFGSFPPDDAVHLYGMASFNHNGYIREEALHYLQNFPVREAIPYILLRLNDWVVQVRHKANAVLAQILPLISVTDLIKYYDTIERLEKTKHAQLTDIHSKILNQLQDSHNKKALLDIMKNMSFKERFFCWKALSIEMPNDDQLLNIAIADPAPEIRQWVIGHLLTNPDFRKRIKILISDKAIRVRYSAIVAIPSEDFEKFRECYEAAIFDTSKSIRDYARFILRSHGYDHFINQYRNQLSLLPEKLNIGAIAGLTETGVQEDIPKMKGFFGSNNPRIRALALSGLCRLKIQDIDLLLLSGLQDSNAKVRNTAVSILSSGYSHLRQELEDVLESGTPKSQKSALKVLIQYGALESLKNILVALRKPSEEVRALAWQLLVSWHQYYAQRPWFNCSAESYKQTRYSFNELQKEKIAPPNHASSAWNDLADLMERLSSRVQDGNI